MARHFIGEPLTPAQTDFELGAMSRGEPGVPGAFDWRDERLEVARLERTWRSTRDDRGDTYLAKHWYALRLSDGRLAEIYFERHPKKAGAARWWLYAIEDEI